jgi:hypothetical protein
VAKQAWRLSQPRPARAGEQRAASQRWLAEEELELLAAAWGGPRPPGGAWPRRSAWGGGSWRHLL